MTKPIILIMSCKRDQENGSNDGCRQSWIREWPNLVDYKFFLGNGCKSTSEDEILLDVPDTYIWLPNKVQAALRWAAEKRYTNFFKCDTDTWIHLPRLLASDFTRSFQIGNHGGAGYWLDRTAAQLVIDAHFNNGGYEDHRIHGVVGEKLETVNDNRYTRCFSVEQFLQHDKVVGGAITAHLIRTNEGYGPPRMIEFHRELLGIL